MDEKDQEKTTFITNQGLYCYKVMPFGLKNAGATYQRLVNCVFHNQIGWNAKVYVDDKLVKSRQIVNHLADLEETFNTFWKYNMKLNRSKCMFVVPYGKFLGFIMSQRRLEANPDKVRAIIEMSPLTNVKEIQHLSGRITALNKFVSWSTNKCFPFFKLLKKNLSGQMNVLRLLKVWNNTWWPRLFLTPQK